jgi:sulfite exporter TauE/SafE
MQEFTYLTAFSIGLMGGVHCVGMCGGIVGALSFGLHRQMGALSPSLFKLLFAYNCGRLFSYTMAGALLGGIGWIAANWLEIRQLQQLLQIFAGVIMLLLGLYLAGWWLFLARLEKMGGLVWKYVEPLGRKLLPVKNVRHALALGLLWGWLPCGLVYSVLIWSIASGGFQQGALLMLSFGLGTLPNLLAMGYFADHLGAWVRNARVKQAAGMMVMGFGVWNLLLVFNG